MDRVIGLIAANFETKGMGELTEDRTIGSLPYGGNYRVIDFPLSNMVNSGINTIGLITPYKYRSIIDHVGAGKAWDLDRKNGGLFGVGLEAHDTAVLHGDAQPVGLVPVRGVVDHGDVRAGLDVLHDQGPVVHVGNDVGGGHQDIGGRSALKVDGVAADIAEEEVAVLTVYAETDAGGCIGDPG